MKIIEAVECDHCRKVHRIGSGSYIIVNGKIEQVLDWYDDKKEMRQIVYIDVVFCLDDELGCFRKYLSDKGID